MGKLDRARWLVMGVAAAAFLSCSGLLCRDASRSPGYKDAGSAFREKGAFLLVNPLLDFDYPVRFSEVKPFERDLDAYVDRLQKQGEADIISVYFRDLDNGYWAGCQENLRFHPASLLKVPVMMTYYKQAESDPAVLQKRIACTSDVPVVAIPNIPPAKVLEVGRSYSVEDLIERMLVYSDNAALALLLMNSDEEQFRKTYTDLGVAPIQDGVEYFLSVKEYGRFFRILYNASYLSKPMSEQALELLTRTAFHDGIVAGVPGGVAVAHKFGERNPPEAPGKLQLHECGIVYHPLGPYLLCIMAQGQDSAHLSRAIADVSRFVYEKVSQKAAL